MEIKLKYDEIDWATDVDLNDQQRKIFKVGFKKKYLLDSFLDNELSNWRWTEQSEIMSVVDQLLNKLLSGFENKTLNKSMAQNQDDWVLQKAKLIRLTQLEEFNKLINQPEHFGWKNLVCQIREMIEGR